MIMEKNGQVSKCLWEKWAEALLLQVIGHIHNRSRVAHRLNKDCVVSTMD
jgi:hypothetical protein